MTELLQGRTAIITGAWRAIDVNGGAFMH